MTYRTAHIKECIQTLQTKPVWAIRDPGLWNIDDPDSKRYKQLKKHFWVDPFNSLCEAEGGSAYRNKNANTNHELCRICLQIIKKYHFESYATKARLINNG